MVTVNQLRTDNMIYGMASSSSPYGVIGMSNAPLVYGHSYLVFLEVKYESDNVDESGFYFKLGNQGYNEYTRSLNDVTTSYKSYTIFGTLTKQSSDANPSQIYFLKKNNTDKLSISWRDLHVIDLTQWFNGNIPAYLISHPEAFGRYYKGSLAYDPGRLEPATGRYLTSVGRNIWDETWRNGYYDTQSGAYVYQASSICSEGNIKVNPNTPYCLYSGTTVGYFNVFEFDSNGEYIGLRQPANGASFVTSANCQSITFGMPGAYGTTYKHDITISEYYSGESGYDQHYPYEVLATIDTGTESLYSAGSAYDSKVPSGLITRRIGSVDLGTLDWSYNSTYGYCYSESLSSLIKAVLNNTDVGNLICAKYTSTSYYIQRSSGAIDKTISVNIAGGIAVLDSAYTDADSFKAAMDGAMLYYELAEPTTEQGTPFQENVPIDDFGQLSWSNTDVPQGNQIFYPVDYKAYEDTLIKYTDGDATSLVRKTDYASPSEAGVVKINPTLGIGINASGTIYTNIATQPMIKAGNYQFHPIVSSNQHQSVFYGLAKAAGANLASSTAETAPDGTNPGVYPAAAKTAIQDMLGITDLIGDINTVLDSVNGVVI